MKNRLKHLSRAAIAFCIAVCSHAIATGSPLEKRTDLQGEIMRPFWDGNIVYKEPLLFIAKTSDTLPEATLLFNPDHILKVESATEDALLEEGRDYVLQGNKVFLPKGSKILFKTQDELYPPADTPDLPGFIRLRGNPDKGLLFKEGNMFHNLQVGVTYSHADKWDGPVPLSAEKFLPKTFKKLKSGQKITLGVSGDSISAGGNASKVVFAKPLQPAYPELVASYLEKRYNSEVILRNRAVGGWTTIQGLADAEGLATNKCDLVIIAYGMNDSAFVETAVYRSNIEQIIKAVRNENNDAEFILVGSVLGNSEWEAMKLYKFKEFLDALHEIQEAELGVAVADVTSIWEKVVGRKKFVDLTGNGVNHPNDFGHRIYAQVITTLLSDDK